jgi:uncharacterized protein (TIGR02001 family)
MKKTLTLSALALAAAAIAPTVAMADDGISYNAGVVTDYRYRGISQTRLKPAVQGGVDYTKGAFYVGAWASTIKWIKDNGVDGSLELDLYGGYKGEITKDLAFDAGVLVYDYVGNKLADTAGGGVYKNANTAEIYGALSFGPATAKLSYALTDLFGNYNFTDGKSSSGSYYLEAAATFNVGPVALTPHIGYQKISNISNASYTDYSVTAGYEAVKGLTLTAAVIGTDANKSFYVPGAAANSSKFLGKSAVVIGAKYAF